MSENKKAFQRSKYNFKSPIGQEYQKLRKISLEQTGIKTIAIEEALKCIKNSSKKPQDIKVADIGCFSGDVLEILQSNLPKTKKSNFYGIDYNQGILDIAKKQYPGYKFVQKDIFNDHLPDFTDTFDLIVSINTLHEVFSIYGANGDFNYESGISAVKESLKNLASTLTKDGHIVIFDGIEHELDKSKIIDIKLNNLKVEKNFKKFLNEYSPLVPVVKKIGFLRYNVNIETFVRFITKYRFLNNLSWEIEKEERYQYLTMTDYIDFCSKINLKITKVNQFRPNINKWQNIVEVRTPNVQFPYEHFVLVAKST